MNETVTCEELARRLRELESRYARQRSAIEEMEAIYAMSLAMICIADIRTIAFTRVNPAFTTVLGYAPEELLGRSFLDFIHPDDVAPTRRVVEEQLRRGEKVFAFENRYRHKDGAYRWLRWNSHPRPDQGFTYAVAIDITEAKEAETALLESEQKYRLTFDASPDAVNINRLEDGLWIDINEGFTRLTGYTREDVIGRTSLEIDIWNDPADRQKLVEELRKNGFCENLEAGFRLKDGRVKPALMSARIIGLKGVAHIISITRSIAALKEAEAEKARLQEKLAQAQKIESIGRLAGGVAHDFNNMLSVILGYTELILDQPDIPRSIHAGLTEIRKAARRSAELTGQLLAFARKQPIAPRSLDLNDTVAGMLRMLRRLIGENIKLAWVPGSALWTVKMDPAQVDQILANLCVNARDAIAEAGMITIETANTVLDEAYCADRPGFVPGRYVALSVSDNGCGMDASTLRQIFEPFFTTKPLGRGTGLGLPMIYGIVKQNNGLINIYSEPGQGTVVKIYLPPVVGEALAPARAPGDPDKRQGGGETILLVEDEPSILNLAKLMLEKLGYSVLAAATPGRALEMALTHPGRIDLLVSDVVMPEMSGPDLAQRLSSSHPGLKRLFMSGYTADRIARHGVLEEGVHFIQKPFCLEELAGKVRAVLDGP